MAQLFNLARMTVSGTPGTGTITLGSAVSGHLTFALAGVGDGETVSYGIRDGANSEVGTGVYTASGTTLTRGPTKSTNSDAAISVTSAAEVFITFRAEDTMAVLATGTVANSASTLDFVLTNWAAYRALIFSFHFMPATDGDKFWARPSTDGGANYDTTGYLRASVGQAGSIETSQGSSSETAFVLSGADGVSSLVAGISGEVYLMDFATVRQVQALAIVAYPRGTGAGGGNQAAVISGVRHSTSQDTDAFRFMFATSTFNASTPGNYTVYGIP